MSETKTPSQNTALHMIAEPPAHPRNYYYLLLLLISIDVCGGDLPATAVDVIGGPVITKY